MQQLLAAGLHHGTLQPCTEHSVAQGTARRTLQTAGSWLQKNIRDRRLFFQSMAIGRATFFQKSQGSACFAAAEREMGRSRQLRRS